MAAKKNNRSSKTDHVLSLLSGKSNQEPSEEKPKEEEPGSEAAAESAPVQEEAAPPQSQPVSESPAPERPGKTLTPPRRESEHLAAPILQVARSNEELARTIRGALEQTLEEELAAREEEQTEEPPARPQRTVSAPAPVPVPDPEPDPVPVSIPDPAPVPPPVPDQTPAPDSASASSAREEEAEKPFAPRRARLPGGEYCVNLMELLVDERVDRYVKLFKVCPCPRCMADVRALALTRLPAKYLVLSPDNASPLLSLYRTRFESDVISQVMMACKTVVEHPRHDR